MKYELKREMRLRLPLDQVFRFFEDPHNLARITPPHLGFHILTPNIEMRPGAIIDYEIRWLRIPLRWRTRIAAYDPPHSFMDEQLRGPYKVWRHFHTFRE